MKYALVALAATALASGVSASANNHRRHNHAEIFKRNKAASNDCNLCTTYVTSRVVPVTGEWLPAVRLRSR